VPAKKYYFKLPDPKKKNKMRQYMWLKVWPADEPRISRVDRAKGKTEKKWGRFGLPCQRICGTIYHRPHFSAIHCWIRRVWYGKMPSVIEVDPYTLLLRVRRRGLLRWILLRWYMTIAELFTF